MEDARDEMKERKNGKEWETTWSRADGRSIRFSFFFWFTQYTPRGLAVMNFDWAMRLVVVIRDPPIRPPRWGITPSFTLPRSDASLRRCQFFFQSLAFVLRTEDS